MFLSISTTHTPATDLGYLLRKHPERMHEVEPGFGTAYVFYPEANEARCEAALVPYVDPDASQRDTTGAMPTSSPSSISQPQ